MAVLILASTAVGVSAAYVDMLDHALYYGNSSALSTGITLIDSGGAGTYEGAVKQWIPMWALDSYEPGTTYTMKFSCTVPQGKVLSFSDTTVLRYHDKTSSIKSQLELQGAYGSASYNEATSTVEFTVKFNTDISNLGGYPIYIYLYCPISSHVYNRNTTNQWSTSVEYDPGGSNYLEFLADIRDQLHAGDDYTPPTSAATDLNNSLTSLDSAEASLSSKADELRSAGSATMSSAISAAQDLPNKIGASTTFLATTFTRFWEAVPEEVTAVLLVCAAILFAGWLIGRIQ